LIANEVEIPSLIIETIKKRDYELFAEFITPYLKDTKGDFLKRLIDVLREVGAMEWERHQLKRSQLAWRRALAVQRLGEYRDQENVEDLIHALNDEDLIISLNAAGALLKMGDNELLKKVISVLLKNEHLTEELFAEILLNYESPIDLDYLLNKRVEKYSALSRIKVINFIEHYNREEGTVRSIDTIKKSKKAIRILLDDENLPDEVFEEILLKYKNPEELERVLSQKVEKFPASSMSKIFDYIGYLNRLEGVPILIDLLGKSKNDEHTICLIKALGNLGSEEALPLLVDFLKSGHPVIRAQSAKALGTLKDRTTLEPLSRLLDDEDYWCRYYAASTIFQMGERGIEFLQNFRNKTHDRFAKDMITQFLHKPQ
jgi:HEAT repeat protein